MFNMKAWNPGQHNWLLLAFQLPARATALGVRVWRRLQAIGAAALKTSLYALPPRDTCREDFEWLLQEIQAGGGSAALIDGRLLGGVDDALLRQRLVQAREREYQALATELRRALGRKGSRAKVPAAGSSGVGPALARGRRRLAEIEARDYFGADYRETVVALLHQAERQIGAAASATVAPEAAGMSAKSKALRESMRGKVWVTRAGVHVDRMACAWLVRGWVEREARFRFVSDPGAKPRRDEIRFDMLDAEFTHEGERCSFEVMLRRFGLGESALRQIGEIVHDLDLKDGRYG